MAEVSRMSAQNSQPVGGPTRAGENVPGPVLFARYAYPPNSHGYCGPADAGAFFEFGASGTDDRGLWAMAQQFAEPGPIWS